MTTITTLHAGAFTIGKGGASPAYTVKFTDGNTLTFGMTGILTSTDLAEKLGGKAVSDITEINIPSGVTGIGSGSFFECSVLTSVTIPEGVTQIGNYAFSGCTSLTSMTIPSSVTVISYNAF